MLSIFNYFDNFLYIFQGTFITLFITLVALCTGICLGFITGIIIFFKIQFFNLFSLKHNIFNFQFFKKLPSFYQIINLYIKFTINTPLLTQLFIGTFVIPIKLNNFLIGLIILGLNSAAHITIIVVEGLNNITENQWYTTISLGLTPVEAVKKIFFSMLIINYKKSLFKEFIALLKESSILSIFGIKEIVSRSKEVSLASYNFLPYMLFVSFLYIVIISSSEYVYNKFFDS